MWAIIPDLIRIGHDVDPILCKHWQPSFEGLPEGLQPYYLEQSKAFAQKLLALAPGLRSTLLAEHEHGVNREAYQAIETDGVALYWVLVQLYHPLNREHRRALEEEIIKFPSKFAHGNPKVPLGKLREKLQEALDIMLRINWDTTAIPLINVLGRRDPLFTVELAKHRALPKVPDDSAVDLGKLLRDVASVVETLDGAGKKWDEGGSARALRAEGQPSSEIQALRKELSSIRTALASQPHQRSRGSLQQQPSAGNCLVKGCGRKIDGYNKTNQWKVCGTHLLQWRSDSKPLNLVDGTTWGRSSCKSALKAMLDQGSITLGKGKRKAHKAKRGRKAGNPSDEEPESPPGGQDGRQTPPTGKKAKSAKALVEALRVRKPEFLSLP
jgi:hypothetical protein